MSALRRLLACVLLLALVASGTALADRGDPKRQITKADQARAKAMLVRPSDVPPQFRPLPAPDDVGDFYCKALDESDLTLTGDAESKQYRGGLVFISSLAQIYATTADANASWRRGTSAAGRRCARAAFVRQAQLSGGTLESFGPLSFPKVAPRTTAFRLVLASTNVRIVVDAVLMQNGRGQAAVLLGSGITPVPKAEEVRLARLVAGRMARAMRG